jgi:ribosomal protein S18 acetylase RimI-like enzyme
MDGFRTLDVTDDPTFALVPPCADPGFDHRSCDYWEDEARGSKAARLDWLEPAAAKDSSPAARSTGNPFLDDLGDGGSANPFAPARSAADLNPFLHDGDGAPANPFAPPPKAGPSIPADAPRKLRLLGRGLGVAGSYAKLLLRDERAVAYCQFGPLTAYPRAQRIRDLYPALPVSPLPAVITCISTVADGRGEGHGRRLVDAVCADLEARGFAAVEAYPELGTRPDATSGATPAFWETAGFVRAIDDPRFPVMRRELA